MVRAGRALALLLLAAAATCAGSGPGEAAGGPGAAACARSGPGQAAGGPGAAACARSGPGEAGRDTHEVHEHKVERRRTYTDDAGAGRGANTNDTEGSSSQVRVTACAPDGRAETGHALAELAAMVLRARGVPARSQPPARAACRSTTLGELVTGHVDAALLTVSAVDTTPAPELRDAGLEELGDAAPATRRACIATRGPLRSLLDLAEPARAREYHLSDETYKTLFCNGTRCPGNLTSSEAACAGDSAACATLLVLDDDVRELAGTVRRHGLSARVLAVDAPLPPAAGRLPLVLCARASAMAESAAFRAPPLGPPPCRPGEPCPFEPYRFTKLVNARSLSRWPSAIRQLVHLRFSHDELRSLAAAARSEGPAAAARDHLAAHPSAAVAPEVRAGVLLPVGSSREVTDTAALVAAAEQAEEDLAAERVPRGARFKAAITDDECGTPLAYRYVSTALMSADYGALAGVVGSACGAAFADLARLSSEHGLPVLAYTPQPAAGTNASALLAAGDSLQHAEVVSALMAQLGWRRLAVLSEPGTRQACAALDRVAAPPDVLLRVELPDSDAESRLEVVKQWIERVSAANVRILYLCVEDASVVRAALCEAARAGPLVWVLPGALPAGWHAGRECALRAAHGALSLAPLWQADWEDGPPAAARPWLASVRTRCLRVARAHGAGPGPGAECESPPAHAALLYDVLRLWGRALDHLLHAEPLAADNLHETRFIQMLIKNATSDNFTGLTGRFEWSAYESGARARDSPLVVRQSVAGRWRRVGLWRSGALHLWSDRLRWPTADGRAPGDGRERCALQPLADALHSDCRAAALALAAMLMGTLLAALAGLALHCRRRAERERRARLRALDMRAGALATRPGLGRWELARDRVVINRKLGTGAFGTVYGGHALLAEGRGWTAVAVKTLKAGASTEEKLDFLSEAEAMKSFDHKNIVRLLGVVTKTAPVCTVMEFMLYGDLKNYLLARRHLAAADSPEEAAEEVSARQLTNMALDAARALSYLAQLRYVHRDLAARNCLVSARRVLKLADFGMTRLVFENDYYRLSRKGMLPVRWMAPESLELGVFSPASDVWSFGVLLYEIVTFGSLPFQGLSNSEVLAQVKAGHTLDLPPGLKPQLEGLMKSCWQRSPRRRPAASEVAAFLAEWPRLLAPCPGAPHDALPLAAEARWLAWAAPTSNSTEATYLSDAPPPLAADTDAFLPPTP